MSRHKTFSVSLKLMARIYDPGYCSGSIDSKINRWRNNNNNRHRGELNFDEPLIENDRN